jgi:hypothetical protein
MMVLKFSMVKSRYQAVVPRYMFLYEIREMSLFKKKKKLNALLKSQVMKGIMIKDRH